MKSKKKHFVLLVLFIITLNLVIGYSARSEEEDKMALATRKEKDVRITRIAFKEGINDAISNYDTYTDSSIMMNFELPKENSTVTYIIQITNIGNADVVLSQISNLPDNLEYSLEGYTLNEKICDEGRCNNGIVKEFELTIKYKKTSITTTTNFDINLGFEFKRFYDISYEGISGTYSSEVLEGEPLNVNFGSNAPDVIEVRKNNKITKDYTYQNGTLKIEKVNGTIFITKYISSISSGTGPEETEEIYKEKILNGADPILEGDLIPVTIDDDGTVHYASLYSKWYEYKYQEWANAVILVGSPSKEYHVGDIILEQDIESYFVWIPRYKYKIWNVGNYTSAYQLSNITDSATDSAAQLRHITGNARKIEIVFESVNTVTSNGETAGSYLTHPAFTTLDVNGLWVGKFETGYNQNSNTEAPITTDNIKSWTTANAAPTEKENPATVPEKIIVKPNVYSWRNQTTSTFFFSSYNYNRSLDSHMMKNTEWGAVAYLSHSQYGIGVEINLNNNEAYLTGYSAAANTDQSGYKGEFGTEDTITQPYNTTTGYHASTTGNITGIYDMAGGTWEYVAEYKDGFGVQSSGGVDSGFIEEDLTTYEKYLDKYNTSSDTTTYNYRILGDATGEMGPFYFYYDKDGTRRYHNGWYANISYFVSSTLPRFGRGGAYYDGVLASVFYFSRGHGGAYDGAGSRLVLSPKENRVVTNATSADFEYTGNEQTYIVPTDGLYKIELWGAQGGNGNATYIGGKGAYTSGEITLKKGDTLYFYVGQQGTSNFSFVSNSLTDPYSKYTWNQLYSKSSITYNSGTYSNSIGGGHAMAGGGATDVRLDNGAWDNFDSLKSRIMVAAGGSGGSSGSYAFVGSAGGALTGLNGQKNSGTDGTLAMGGTQMSGGTKGGGWLNNTATDGSFGKGGQGFIMASGGSGYYGGGASPHGDATGGTGGSGSSFISGYPDCNAISKESTEEEIIHTGEPDHYSGKVFENGQMIAGNASMPNYQGNGNMTGNAGHGHAKITLIK